MSRRRYSRKRSSTNSVADATHIANRLPWQAALALGLASFAAFYWGIPAWISHQVATLDGNQFQSLAIALLERRVHYSRWVGIALLIACCAVAAWKYFAGRRVSTRAQQRVTLWSRILGRRLD